jgi:hypothetical protein
MKKNKNFLSEDDTIDFVDIINYLKKNLLISIIIISTCLAASYLYYKNLDKFVKNTVTITFPPISKFERFFLTEFDRDKIFYYNRFVSGVDIDLLSEDKFKNFLLDNKSKFSIQNVNDYSINYEGKKIFSDNGIIFTRNTNSSYINDFIGKEYSIKYKLGGRGIEILNSFVNHTKKELIDAFKKEATTNITMHIDRLKNDLKIAQELGIERPFNTTLNAQNLFLQHSDYLDSGFFLGSYVISIKIDQLRLKKLNIDKNNFDYEIIYNSNKSEIPIGKDITNYLILGFIIGLVALLIISFIRTLVFKIN